MKFGTLKNGRTVAIRDGRAVDLKALGFQTSLLGLIRAGESTWQDVQDALENERGEAFNMRDLWAPILRPPKIVAIGLNYRDHAAESNMEIPTEPLVFAKFPSSIAGPFDPIHAHTDLTERLDYEVELGVVIGKLARKLSPENALGYVFGYTVVNDLSARDLQFADKQWVRAKSLDSHCPVGPWIITRDEIPDPGKLRLGCDVNGVRLQDSSTEHLVFGVPELISRLSYSFTLEPGDLIITGTPAGVGFARKPPVYLKPGDVVKTWIEGIGELENTVVE
jgi:2-keto-4-pentenoate hydratase/2-oxohepta-3-ene-1,7-dioic acid hydratase in catechol pathway